MKHKFSHGFQEWQDKHKNLSPEEWRKEYNRIYKGMDDVNGGEYYSLLMSTEPSADNVETHRCEATLPFIKKGDKVIDVGCLCGRYVKFLDKHGHKACGVDIVSDAVQFGNRFFGDTRLFVGDIYSLPFLSKSFDVVVCFETLEHLPRYEEATMELLRITKPGGWCLLSVPYKNRIGSVYHVHSFEENWMDWLGPTANVTTQVHDIWMFTKIKRA